MAKKIDDKVLTIGDPAAYLKLPKSTVDQLYAVYKVLAGPVWHFHKDVIDHWLGGTRSPLPSAAERESGAAQSSAPSNLNRVIFAAAGVPSSRKAGLL